MMKLTSLSFLTLATLAASSVYAAGGPWQGEFSDITPTHSGVTEDYCKQHVLDTYQTSAGKVDKEVTGQNGVKAKNITFNTKEQGGVYMYTGSSELSGTYEGKPWKDKVHFIGLALQKDGMEQGAWWSKDCKGFYKVGPSS